MANRAGRNKIRYNRNSATQFKKDMKLLMSGELWLTHLTMGNETILIVEDNPVNQKLLVTILRPHGYRLLTAADGEEALTIASQELPHLILMDLQLPKMNGYTATQRLKENPETAGIPVIALTAHAMPEERYHAQQVGFDGYITKPIDTRSFPSQIRVYLERAGA